MSVEISASTKNLFGKNTFVELIVFLKEAFRRFAKISLQYKRFTDTSDILMFRRQWFQGRTVTSYLLIVRILFARYATTSIKLQLTLTKLNYFEIYFIQIFLDNDNEVLDYMATILREWSVTINTLFNKLHCISGTISDNLNCSSTPGVCQ